MKTTFEAVAPRLAQPYADKLRQMLDAAPEFKERELSQKNFVELAKRFTDSYPNAQAWDKEMRALAGAFRAVGITIHLRLKRGRKPGAPRAQTPGYIKAQGDMPEMLEFVIPLPANGSKLDARLVIPRNLRPAQAERISAVVHALASNAEEA